MDLGLRGKVALVAAASQGLGRAAAFAFAREGCKVAICARNAAPLEDTANAIRKETKADVAAIAADISRADGVKAFADGALRAFGGVDVLVPNACGPPPGGFEALADDQWAKRWELTFQITVRLDRACLPSMRTRGGGAVVVILSVSERPRPVPRNLLRSRIACRLFARRVRARPARAAGCAVPGATLAALPCLRSGPTDPGERIATNSGSARPAHAQLGLVLHSTVGAIPAESDHFRQLPGPDPPVRPREDRASDEEHQ